jgi:glycosyltransferase involved in cell wall biosynthesis
MLEAMACGTPVAAYPVDGPLEVLGTPDGHKGGVLHADLHQAFSAALQVSRAQARERALEFSWRQAGQMFQDNLVAARPVSKFPREMVDVVRSV